jgi:hypothetical protein
MMNQEYRAELKTLRLDDRAAHQELRTIDTNMRAAQKQAKAARKLLNAELRKIDANMRAAEREARSARKTAQGRRQAIARRAAILKGRLA